MTEKKCRYMRYSPLKEKSAYVKSESVLSILVEQEISLYLPFSAERKERLQLEETLSIDFHEKRYRYTRYSPLKEKTA